MASLQLEHNKSVEKDREDPRDADVDDGEWCGEEDSMESSFHLPCVLLNSYQDEGKGSVLSQGSPGNSLHLTDKPPIRPTLS